MKIALLSLIAGCMTLLSSCGFHLPEQTKLNEAIPEINVVGEYHHQFFKMVVRDLELSGVKVNAQNSDFMPDTTNTDIPLLMIPLPTEEQPIVAVDSKAQALENNLIIRVSATLKIANHRPILMRNSLTRSILSKTGHALASQSEVNLVTSETYQELASQLVLRLSYLGRLSDPDGRQIKPSDLVLTEGESIDVPDTEGMTLIEALQAQDSAEKAAATHVELESMQNQKQIFNSVPKLPNEKAILLHQAPTSVNTNDF